MPGNPPLACRLDALAPKDRARHALLLGQLRSSLKGFEELPNGFAFRFPGDASFPRLAEWLTLERRCCPFLEFELVEDGEEDSTILRVTGGRGAKAFIASEFIPRSSEEPLRFGPRTGLRPYGRRARS